MGSILLCNPLFSMESKNEFVDVAVKLKQKFHRDGSPAYLECRDSQTFPHRGLAVRSFHIKPKDGEFKDIIVGEIGTKYNIHKKQVEIGWIEVYEKYQRHGYGESAVRIVLGIYRSKMNQKLDFDHFFLTVGKGRDREAARELYKKVGFSIQQDLDEIGYLYLTLNR